MICEVAKYSHIGKRDNNEDSYAVFQNGNTYMAIVADGLGGHANGEIVSKMAVDHVCTSLLRKQVDEDELAYAIINASTLIRNSRYSGHTTIAALWMQDNFAVAAHVGDTRIYQIRNGKIIYQSVDHSQVQMAVLVGALAPEAIRKHKDRNKLFRALGVENEETKVESNELNVRSGDRFLLCSDGFWEPVTEADMLRTASQTTSAQQWLSAMQRFVTSANDPRQDNHTAIAMIVR